MTLTWYATACVRLQWRDTVIWFDPWFSRNDESDPHIHASIDVVDDGSTIFMSHGHFDHLQDVPSILVAKPAVEVYCSAAAKNAIEAQLQTRGEIPASEVPVCMERVHVPSPGDTITLTNPEAKVDVIKSEHVKFDARTILRALFNWKTWKNIKKLVAVSKPYPKGDVFGYDVHLGKDGRVVMFGSLCTKYPDLLEQHSHPDVLLVPCAGRFDSDRIGVEIARHVKPRHVIPIHQDNFFPPITYHTPTTRLKEGAATLEPPALYMELPFEQPVEFQLG